MLGLSNELIAGEGDPLLHPFPSNLPEHIHSFLSLNMELAVAAGAAVRSMGIGAHRVFAGLLPTMFAAEVAAEVLVIVVQQDEHGPPVGEGKALSRGGSFEEMSLLHSKVREVVGVWGWQW